MDRVFVYGTLKRGFPYHETGLTGQQFLGRCRTREAYPLVIAGPWYSPVLIDEVGNGRRVTGEIYAVDPSTLTKLDRMEGTHLPQGYRRITIAVERLDDCAALDLWAYVKARAAAGPIHDGPLAEYHPDPRYVLAADRTS